MPTVVDRGLEGVVVGSTQLSNVEGTIGRLTYRGYDIDDLAPNATFEEIVHLLLYGHLPNRHELDTLKRELGARRALPEPLVNVMQNVPKTAWPMDVLRTVVSGLGLFSPVNAHGEHLSDVHTAIELIAKMPTILASWDRIRRGLDPIAPRTDLSQAGNFLYMRTGKVPHAIEEDALDTYFVLLADHSFNASTFAARVVASTRADIYLGHGRARDAAGRPAWRCGQRRVSDRRRGQDARERRAVRARHPRSRAAHHGHGPPRVQSPRPTRSPLGGDGKRVVESGRRSPWYETAHAIEEASRKVLQERKPGNTIYANVDFYTAPVLADLGVPGDEFTGLFACGRIAGWTAHVLEQLADNRLIRPQATYEGPAAGPYLPIDKRTTNGARA